MIQPNARKDVSDATPFCLCRWHHEPPPDVLERYVAKQVISETFAMFTTTSYSYTTFSPPTLDIMTFGVLISLLGILLLFTT